jgi:hypothetical protein
MNASREFIGLLQGNFYFLVVSPLLAQIVLFVVFWNTLA